MTTVFDPEALEEYHEAAQYSEDRFGLGRQFVAAVQAAIAAIESSPTRYPPVGRDIRIFRMRRFPYYIFISMIPMPRRLLFTPWHTTKGVKIIGGIA